MPSELSKAFPVDRPRGEKIRPEESGYRSWAHPHIASAGRFFPTVFPRSGHRGDVERPRVNIGWGWFQSPAGSGSGRESRASSRQQSVSLRLAFALHRPPFPARGISPSGGFTLSPNG